MLDQKILTLRRSFFLWQNIALHLKLKVITAYLNSEGGYSCLAKKYGVKDATQVLRWVNAFKKFGKDGLC